MKRTFSKFIKERKYDVLIKKIMRIVLEEDSSFIDVGCYRGNFLIEEF